MYPGLAVALTALEMNLLKRLREKRASKRADSSGKDRVRGSCHFYR
jgi:hypothetical protein